MSTALEHPGPQQPALNAVINTPVEHTSGYVGALQARLRRVCGALRSERNRKRCACTCSGVGVPRFTSGVVWWCYFQKAHLPGRLCGSVVWEYNADRLQVQPCHCRRARPVCPDKAHRGLGLVVGATGATPLATGALGGCGYKWSQGEGPVSNTSSGRISAPTRIKPRINARASDNPRNRGGGGRKCVYIDLGPLVGQLLMRFGT
jgi:hypothetical protein